MAVYMYPKSFVQRAIQGHLLQVFRSFSSNLKFTRKWKNTTHVYSYSLNWGSLSELSHVLQRDVILNQDGLVVINKPFGIGKEKYIVNENKIAREEKLRTASVGEKEMYISEILPILARNLGYNLLEVVKIPERYTSGVTVLSSSEELTLHIQNSIRKGKDQGMLLNTYWLLCVGSPDPPFYNSKIAFIYENDKISGGSQPVIQTAWTKKAAKRGDVIKVSVEHTVKCEGPYGSLVEVKPSRTKNHFLRFYMAYMLSPVLGDNLYGSRVQKIGEMPVAISPFSDRAKMPKRLEDQLLSQLDLRRGDEYFIPAHIHLRRVTIPHFYGKGQSLNIEAPIPEYFDWTWKRLLLKEVVKDENREVSY